MISIILTIIAFILIASLYVNQPLTLNLRAYISTIIIGFIITIYHLIHLTIPYDLTSLMLIASLFILIKHRHLFNFKRGRLFLKHMFIYLYRIILLLSACIYISTVEIPIINGLALWFATIAYSTTFAFICYISWSSAYGSHLCSKNVDLIMVLGAGIFTEEVTPMLAERLNCAIKVYESQKHSPYMLVSGGQGPDEPITEALAMKRYLIAKGVPEKRILMEEQSTNTYTNFQYSKPIIEEHFGRRAQFLCVTSQFHILRSLRLANKVGLEFYGLGSHTPYHFFSIALIKDFLGLMYQYKVILTIYFAIIFWVSLIRMIIV